MAQSRPLANASTQASAGSSKIAGSGSMETPACVTVFVASRLACRLARMLIASSEPHVSHVASGYVVCHVEAVILLGHSLALKTHPKVMTPQPRRRCSNPWKIMMIVRGGRVVARFTIMLCYVMITRHALLRPSSAMVSVNAAAGPYTSSKGR